MSVNLGDKRIGGIVKTISVEGGTGDYNELKNKPQINGVTLVGNLNTEELGIITGETTDVYTKEETKSLIDSSIANKTDKNYVDEQLKLKSDINNTYTKNETDTRISDLNKSINTKLANKADITNVYTKEQTSDIIDNKLKDKVDKSYIDEKLDAKADKTDTYTKEEVDNKLKSPSVSGDTYPIGTIGWYAGTTTPQNWLLCDGREVSREDYSELFAIIGTTWGAGDGSTSFNLPNFTNRMPVGAGDDYPLASNGGESSYKLTQKQLPAISLGIDYYQSGNNGKYISANKGNGVYVGTGNTNIIGNGEAINNMPPYAGVYAIIKAKQSAGVVAQVIDNVSSSSPTDALSVNQGKILNDKINNLAVFIGNESVVSNDGWKQLTPSDNFDLYDSSVKLTCRKIGNIVEIKGVLKPKNEIEASSTSVTMCTLPVGYRPNSTHYYTCQGSDNNKWLLTIYENGNVGISRYGASNNINIPITAWLPFNAMFMID